MSKDAHEVKVKNDDEELTLRIASTGRGKISLEVYPTTIMLTLSEVRELCAALRMASEESQAELDTGPAFARSACIEVVAMSAREAAEFIGRTDAPGDLGPADGTRYREGARVWGFRIK
jgi:hypothetical protein